MPKFLFTLLPLQVLLTMGVANAVPVMNENASMSRSVTIFPDHADPTAFYIAPNYMSLCLDAAGTPYFSYQDLKVKNGTHGIVQMTLCNRYIEDQLAAAKQALFAKVPTARFVALPFVSSRVVFSPVYEPFIAKEFCSHIAGMVGDEQTCAFRLNTQGRKIFIRQVHDRVAMTMQYEYNVAGFIRKPDGGFAAQSTTYAVAVRVGGEELKAHPELFSDVNGRSLKAR